MSEKNEQEKSVSQVLRNRREKAEFLGGEGVPLFPNSFRKDTDIGTIPAGYGELDEAGLDNLDRSFRVAGRVMSLRSFGKVTFLHLQDQSGRMDLVTSSTVSAFRVSSPVLVRNNLPETPRKSPMSNFLNRA